MQLQMCCAQVVKVPSDCPLICCVVIESLFQDFHRCISFVHLVRKALSFCVCIPQCISFFMDYLPKT